MPAPPGLGRQRHRAWPLGGAGRSPRPAAHIAGSPFFYRSLVSITRTRLGPTDPLRSHVLQAPRRVKRQASPLPKDEPTDKHEAQQRISRYWASRHGTPSPWRLVLPFRGRQGLLAGRAISSVRAPDHAEPLGAAHHGGTAGVSPQRPPPLPLLPFRAFLALASPVRLDPGIRCRVQPLEPGAHSHIQIVLSEAAGAV